MTTICSISDMYNILEDVMPQLLIEKANGMKILLVQSRKIRTLKSTIKRLQDELGMVGYFCHSKPDKYVDDWIAILYDPDTYQCIAMNCISKSSDCDYNILKLTLATEETKFSILNVDSSYEAEPEYVRDLAKLTRKGSFLCIGYFGKDVSRLSRKLNRLNDDEKSDTDVFASDEWNVHTTVSSVVPLSNGSEMIRITMF